MKTLRVEIQPTDRTDLLCIHCGRFLIGGRGFAIVAPGGTTVGAQAGLHRPCCKVIKAPIRRKAKAKAA